MSDIRRLVPFLIHDPRPFIRFFLEATAAAYALSSTDGDLPGAFVISLTLWAIFDHQRSSEYVHTRVSPMGE